MKKITDYVDPVTMVMVSLELIRKGKLFEAEQAARKKKKRKMGELLRVPGLRQKPGEYQTKQKSPEITLAPTLADLGISKRESAEKKE